MFRVKSKLYFFNIISIIYSNEIITYSDMVKYKEAFFWRNFINVIKSLKITVNNDNIMVIEDDDF